MAGANTMNLSANRSSSRPDSATTTASPTMSGSAPFLSRIWTRSELVIVPSVRKHQLTANGAVDLKQDPGALSLRAGAQRGAARACASGAGRRRRRRLGLERRVSASAFLVAGRSPPLPVEAHPEPFRRRSPRVYIRTAVSIQGDLDGRSRLLPQWNKAAHARQCDMAQCRPEGLLDHPRSDDEDPAVEHDYPPAAQQYLA